MVAAMEKSKCEKYFWFQNLCLQIESIRSYTISLVKVLNEFNGRFNQE